MMKHRWHETISNTVFYHQILFNIMLIVEKLLNNNVELTEKVYVMKFEQNKQQRTSKNNKVNQIARAEAKEFILNRLENGKEHDERTVKNNENDMDDKANNDVVEKKESIQITQKKVHANNMLFQNMQNKNNYENADTKSDHKYDVFA